uniref:Uncharacterized protein n=1 Tax=Chromera velia CCMP2878 TaxID=1169474 RepID=A0A0G4IA00_9ALVE|eukprot:Cvel_12404.t1-p1 / transcript=Cvel_12404.t1 / gene=Cvel_12404 / organism=Chromera_velia_CCMP2878 / gene_product=hypothetical protein / transcript_product=hypothetical protein / location=Cvel_scaffold811:14454-35963(-) / protein_length=1966 / sequence_SO=supercontig / SO=protein_coding / is_pseudo=false
MRLRSRSPERQKSPTSERPHRPRKSVQWDEEKITKEREELKAFRLNKKRKSSKSSPSGSAASGSKADDASPVSPHAAASTYFILSFPDRTIPDTATPSSPSLGGPSMEIDAESSDHFTRRARRHSMGEFRRIAAPLDEAEGEEGGGTDGNHLNVSSLLRSMSPQRTSSPFINQTRRSSGNVRSPTWHVSPSPIPVTPPPLAGTLGQSNPDLHISREATPSKSEDTSNNPIPIPKSADTPQALKGILKQWSPRGSPFTDFSRKISPHLISPAVERRHIMAQERRQMRMNTMEKLIAGRQMGGSPDKQTNVRRQMRLNTLEQLLSSQQLEGTNQEEGDAPSGPPSASASRQASPRRHLSGTSLLKTLNASDRLATANLPSASSPAKQKKEEGRPVSTPKAANKKEKPKAAPLNDGVVILPDIEPLIEEPTPIYRNANEPPPSAATPTTPIVLTAPPAPITERPVLHSTPLPMPKEAAGMEKTSQASSSSRTVRESAKTSAASASSSKTKGGFRRIASPTVPPPARQKKKETATRGREDEEDDTDAQQKSRFTNVARAVLPSQLVGVDGGTQNGGEKEKNRKRDTQAKPRERDDSRGPRNLPSNLSPQLHAPPGAHTKQEDPRSDEEEKPRGKVQTEEKRGGGKGKEEETEKEKENEKRESESPVDGPVVVIQEPASGDGEEDSYESSAGRQMGGSISSDTALSVPVNHAFGYADIDLPASRSIAHLLGNLSQEWTVFGPLGDEDSEAPPDDQPRATPLGIAVPLNHAFGYSDLTLSHPSRRSSQPFRTHSDSEMPPDDIPAVAPPHATPPPPSSLGPLGSTVYRSAPPSPSNPPPATASTAADWLLPPPPVSQQNEVFGPSAGSGRVPLPYEAEEAQPFLRMATRKTTFAGITSADGSSEAPRKDRVGRPPLLGSNAVRQSSAMPKRNNFRKPTLDSSLVRLEIERQTSGRKETPPCLTPVKERSLTPPGREKSLPSSTSVEDHLKRRRSSRRGSMMELDKVARQFQRQASQRLTSDGSTRTQAEKQQAALARLISESLNPTNAEALGELAVVWESSAQSSGGNKGEPAIQLSEESMASILVSDDYLRLSNAAMDALEQAFGELVTKEAFISKLAGNLSQRAVEERQKNLVLTEEDGGLEGDRLKLVRNDRVFMLLAADLIDMLDTLLAAVSNRERLNGRTWSLGLRLQNSFHRFGAIPDIEKTAIVCIVTLHQVSTDSWKVLEAAVAEDYLLAAKTKAEDGTAFFADFAGADLDFDNPQPSEAPSPSNMSDDQSHGNYSTYSVEKQESSSVSKDEDDSPATGAFKRQMSLRQVASKFHRSMSMASEGSAASDGRSVSGKREIKNIDLDELDRLTEALEHADDDGKSDVASSRGSSGDKKESEGGSAENSRDGITIPQRGSVLMLKKLATAIRRLSKAGSEAAFLAGKVFQKIITKAPSFRKLFVRPDEAYTKHFSVFLEQCLDYAQRPRCFWQEHNDLAVKHIIFGVGHNDITMMGRMIVEALQDIGGEGWAEDYAETWQKFWTEISRSLRDFTAEGAHPVARAIIMNDPELLEAALAEQDRSRRSNTACSILLNGKPASPLKWALSEGKLRLAEILLKDVLAIRADANNIYFGIDTLWESHPDLVALVCKTAPELLTVLLNGHIWASERIMNGKRKAEAQELRLSSNLEKLSALAGLMLWLLTNESLLAFEGIAALQTAVTLFVVEIFQLLLFVLIVCLAFASAVDMASSVDPLPEFLNFMRTTQTLWTLTLKIWFPDWEQRHLNLLWHFAFLFMSLMGVVFLLKLLIAHLSIFYSRSLNQMEGLSKIARAEMVLQAEAQLSVRRMNRITKNLNFKRRMFFDSEAQKAPNGALSMEVDTSFRLPPCGVKGRVADRMLMFEGDAEPHLPWPANQQANTVGGFASSTAQRELRNLLKLTSFQIERLQNYLPNYQGGVSRDVSTSQSKVSSLGPSSGESQDLHGTGGTR